MKTLIWLFFFLLKLAFSSEDKFVFNGFGRANLSLDGITAITANGLLELTNATGRTIGHAFYPVPLHFKSTNGQTFSFSTTFVFALLSEISDLSGNGLAFFISHTNNFSSASSSQYLGLFNQNHISGSKNHIFAVELDTIKNPEVQDIDDNHVGIDINSLISNSSYTAGYFDDNSGSFNNLTLTSGQPMQVWIDYNSKKMQLNVTLSPMKMPKPSRPLLSSFVNLSSLMLGSMYIGFSSSSSVVHVYNCILGWSFTINGEAAPLDYARLPSLPPVEGIGNLVVSQDKDNSVVLVIWLPIALGLLLILIIVATILIVRRIKYAELLEDWELEYGPHRFLYKDLFQATKGFSELLGSGGFGRVYRGVLPTSKVEVAVKKISHESRQGLKEFIAEICSIGRLRHRNLVQLLGYCRRKGELILVYEFMPNGSLDRFLYDRTKPTLNWARRFQIIKGVASGLLYLHERWEQVVIHRDIKASNVLLDSEFNGRLGDFGLARLYDHGTDLQTTHVVGTMGYLAPELARTGKASTKTDVFAFGVFLLEVACGRKPVHPQSQGEALHLMDWVLASWQRGLLLETKDLRLGENYISYEVESVLKLGLLCSNPLPAARPSMQQVVQFLEGDAALPELPQTYMSFSSMLLSQNKGVDGGIKSSSSSEAIVSALIEGR